MDAAQMVQSTNAHEHEDKRLRRDDTETTSRASDARVFTGVAADMFASALTKLQKTWPQVEKVLDMDIHDSATLDALDGIDSVVQDKDIAHMIKMACMHGESRNAQVREKIRTAIHDAGIVQFLQGTVHEFGTALALCQALSNDDGAVPHRFIDVVMKNNKSLYDNMWQEVLTLVVFRPLHVTELTEQYKRIIKSTLEARDADEE